MKVALFTNPYLSSNYKYQTNKQAQPSFQGMTNKVPKEINDAFSILRKKVATLPERGSNDVLTVKLIDRADEAACVTVERKRKKSVARVRNDGRNTTTSISSLKRPVPPLASMPIYY